MDAAGVHLNTRTLVTDISDVSTGMEEALELHLRMALRLGWTEEELTEAFLHLLGYVGAPRETPVLWALNGWFHGIGKRRPLNRPLFLFATA